MSTATGEVVQSGSLRNQVSDVGELNLYNRIWPRLRLSLFGILKCGSIVTLTLMYAYINPVSSSYSTSLLIATLPKI